MRTLRNAVERGKVHHAYLFVGSRGTGKTSMAKILAACLNCERGPTVEPCGACSSCVSIASATSLDVIEMDAASNNSVDDIRDLRDKVAYAPVSGRHKVYILDEAHMLSPQAWNAFLKTLEEPPPATIFVLATTEAQKVLPTVVDRCHRFDFGRPSAAQVGAVLRKTADEEGIDAPDAVLGLIARAATGSFRDALGTLEQLVTYSPGRIELDDVLAVLGVVDADLLFETVDAVAAGDPRATLLAAARVADAGREASRFLRDLEAHARALLVVRMLGEVPAELRSTSEQDERLAEQAARLGPGDGARLLDGLAAGLEAVRGGAEARIQLELALVKAAAPEEDPSTRALVARIDRLEQRLAAGETAPAASPPRPASGAEPQPPRPVPAATVAPPAGPVLPGPATVAPGGAAVAAVTAAPPAAEATSPHLDLEIARELWPAIVDTVRQENAMLAAILCDARPIALAGDELTVAFAPGAAFLKRKAEGQAHRTAVVEALRGLSGRGLRVRYELREDAAEGEEAAGAPPALSEEELIARFLAEFDAEEILDDEDPETREAP